MYTSPFDVSTADLAPNWEISGYIINWLNMEQCIILKFVYSEKATKVCEISTLLLSYVVPVKSKLKISQNFVAFSEYMNFKNHKSHKGQFVFKVHALWEGHTIWKIVL